MLKIAAVIVPRQPEVANNFHWLHPLVIFLSKGNPVFKKIFAENLLPGNCEHRGVRGQILL